jgi:hypothetical protein
MVILLEHHGEEVTFLWLFLTFLALVLTLAGVLAMGGQKLKLLSSVRRALLDSENVIGRRHCGVLGNVADRRFLST